MGPMCSNQSVAVHVADAVQFCLEQLSQTRTNLTVGDSMQRQMERLLAERRQHHDRLQVVADAAVFAAGVLESSSGQQTGNVRHRGARLVHLDACAVCQFVHQPQEAGLTLCG